MFKHKHLHNSEYNKPSFCLEDVSQVPLFLFIFEYDKKTSAINTYTHVIHGSLPFVFGK